jgi:hypothetical protein
MNCLLHIFLACFSCLNVSHCYPFYRDEGQHLIPRHAYVFWLTEDKQKKYGILCGNSRLFINIRAEGVIVK